MHEIEEENTHIRMLENFNLNNNTHIVSMSYAKYNMSVIEIPLLILVLHFIVT